MTVSHNRGAPGWSDVPVEIHHRSGDRVGRQWILVLVASIVIGAALAACGGNELPAEPPAAAAPTATPTATPTRRPRPPHPGLQQPRPAIVGRIGEGVSPCVNTPVASGSLSVVLAYAPGGDCGEAVATPLKQVVPSNANADFSFAAATAGPTPTGTLTPTPVPQYCVKVYKPGASPGSKVLVGESPVFAPGIDHAATVTLPNDICIDDP